MILAKMPQNQCFIQHLKPKIFVFENVTGILSASANGKKIFPQVIAALGKHYHLVNNPDTLLFNTANYGVPQIRKRIIIMGVRKDIDSLSVQELYDNVIKTHYDPEMEIEKRGNLKRFVDVKQALGDLPIVFPGQDVSSDAYDYPCDNDFLKRIGKKGVAPLYDHICRNHNDILITFQYL